MPCGVKGAPTQGDSAAAEAWPPVFADLRRPAVVDVGTHQKRSSLQWGATAMWDGTTGPQYGVGMANGSTIHFSPHQAKIMGALTGQSPRRLAALRIEVSSDGA
jgi:hypothetical protein